MLIMYHEVVMHVVVRKLLTYRQTNKQINKLSENITACSSSLVEEITNSRDY